MNRDLTRPLLWISAAILASSVASASDSNGKTLFRDKECAACHGLLGQGGVSGPRLAPGPVPFDSFKQQIRTPIGEMPPFSPVVVSNNDLQAIYEYLKSIQAGPSASEIPALRERLPKQAK